ncbi:MAG: DNA polymerase III subunit beta [Provencibacterium sp.]|nr:DNA polymerase III subunit beta [Provencibacterium sp.]
MKVICNKEKLCEAVANVSRAVASKSTILALEGILLKAEGSTLTLTGYDLELGITTLLEAEVGEPGEIILTARLFSDMIRRMPYETITIESDQKLLTHIVSGAAEYTILGLDPQEFPELPAIGEAALLSLQGETLKSMIDQTLFAVAVSDAKPVHKGSLFDLKDGMLTVVSVDGYRLALRREALNAEEESSFVIPGKTLSEVSKLIGGEDKKIELSVSSKYIIFRIGGYQVLSRLLEGEFLDYRAAVPKQHTTEITVSTRSMVDSIERISLLISDKLRSPLKIRFTDSHIQSSCSTAIGKANDTIACQMTGDEVEMGFNSKYLLDALRACETDEAVLQLGGPLAPMKVVPKDSEAFLFLVLPVRLKSE